MAAEVGREFKTTFSERLKLSLPVYISVNNLLAIAQTIAERLSVDISLLKFSFETEGGADFETSSPAGIANILKDAKKYGRNIKGISIKSGIVLKNKDSDTHYSVEFTLHRYDKRYDGSLRVYAVAEDVADSQHVIDWGTGLINDFKLMSLDEVKMSNGDFVIDAKSGKVRKWDANDQVQKVELVNDTKQKWSDKSNIIGIMSIIIAILLALITWAYFSNKS